MASLTAMSPDFAVLGGKENSVASVQMYFANMFACYPIFYDIQDTEAPKQRQYPCIVIDQVDFHSDVSSFFGSKTGENSKGRWERLQMYFRAVVDMSASGEQSTKRFSRRMRDQIFWVLTHAGMFDNKAGAFYCDPIFLYDFSTLPPTKTKHIINVEKSDGSIQDRFVANYQYPHLVQYDLLARFSYVTPEV